MKYRPEIDGLRAVAVAPVILFHAGAQQISGGFLGVDLFFVISGFLITGIISREMREGRFSFRAFYKRRARRILPMLLVVIACSAPFAWLFMSRGEFLVFVRSAIYVLLFVSNFFFFKQSSYFDHSAETSPLLHTWRIFGVEEQYYILFPLLMLLLWRKTPRSIAPALAGLLAASLLLCIACARAYPDFTFYLPLTRAWELLAGALCALAPSRPFAKHGAWRLPPQPRGQVALLGLFVDRSGEQAWALGRSRSRRFCVPLPDPALRSPGSAGQRRLLRVSTPPSRSRPDQL